MNIAMVVYSHYSRDARVRRYAEALARRGFKVDVICLKEDYKPKETNISLIQYPLPRKRFGRLWYLWEYILFFIYTTILLTIKHLRKRYKVIHAHNMPDILVFTALVPKMLGAKIILDMHDPMPELYMSKYKTKENSQMVKLLKLLENISFRFADKIITANEAFKSLFLKRNNIDPDKVNVILNCPDPRIFNRQQTTDNRQQFTMLYMGTIDERFGLDIAIEAIPMIVKKIPNFIFIIIPKLEEEGEYFKNLKDKVQSAKLEKYVFFISPLPLEKVAEKTKEVDIGVVLAKNGVFTDNIFPVKLLEFVQMGVPVIATKTKILNRYFDNDSIYFLAQNTSEDFAQAALILWRNKNLRESFAKNAKNYLRKHNWPKEKERYLELIEFLH